MLKRSGVEDIIQSITQHAGISKTDKPAPAVVSTSSRLVESALVKQVLSTQIRRFNRIAGFQFDCVVGWGRKPSGKRAVSISKEYDVPFILLEDGFIRSVNREDCSISLVLDREGIFYDASAVSTLETYIKESLTDQERNRAKKLIDTWNCSSISKYNAYPDLDDNLPDEYVLVVDQVRGDLSISYGLANADTFQRMLSIAMAENPDKTIIVKIHPDIYTRAAASHYNPEKLKRLKQVQVVASNCHPVRLIKNADVVYTVTSQVGFEALIRGKPVRTFGMPFYAGWGLTVDDLPGPDRRHSASLEQLVHATLVRYSQYINPVTEEAGTVESSLDYITLQRERQLAPDCNVCAIGFSRWKKPFIRRFLKSAELKFYRKLPDDITSTNKTIAIWGNKYHHLLCNRPNTLRIEDGFLRSSGLGADFISPLSLVVDDVGIYYDASKPSRLELILNQLCLSQEQLSRAQQLKHKITKLRLTKYNVGSLTWQRPKSVDKVILIVGQVESDASIEYGSPTIKTNLDLIKTIRISHPNAYLVYKPHPDVLAKLRQQGNTETEASMLCDEIIGNCSADNLFEQIDELHTMTSLMGFEALLRGVSVVCHGLPFYAGWGLTRDMLTCNRRKTSLTIDALVYGALIAYPSYMHINKPIFIEAEAAVDQLHKLANKPANASSRYRPIRRFGASALATARRHVRS